MTRSALRALDKHLKNVGIHPFQLPDTTFLPGAIVDKNGQLLDNLSSGRTTKLFGDDAKVGHTDFLDAKTRLDKATVTQMVTPNLSLGIPNLPAEVDAALSHTRKLDITIGRLWARYMTLTEDAETFHFEPADYIAWLNKPHVQQSLKEAGYFDGMSRHVGIGRRPFDVCGRLIYAESITFTFHTQGSAQANLKATIDAVDVGVGSGFERTGDFSLHWTEGKNIPLGFTPVKYRWSPRNKMFQWDANARA